jgi:PAS domain S-box-containing protein
MKRFPFKLAGWLTALVLLVFLYWQSNQVDGALHVRTVAHFEQLREQDARLNQYVLQSRYGLLRNYDPLVATQQKIATLLTDLQLDQPTYFGQGDQSMAKEFKHYQELFDAKFALVENFKSHNSVLRNSMQYFPLAIKQLMDSSHGSPHRDHLLHDLLESVLLFDIQTGAQLQPHIEQVMAELLQFEGQKNPALTSMARHVKVIIDFESEVNQFTKDITQSESTTESNTLFAMYGQNFSDRQLNADRYRLALALLAATMLGYVAWTLTALQSARKTLTQSLRELEFQKYALDAHSIVSVADHSGKILAINAKFSEVSQYEPEELLGQDHRLLNSGHHSKEFFKAMWATIGHGKIWQNEVKNRRKDGTFYWVDSTIVPFMDENGKVLRYVSIRTDITDRKVVGEQLALQRTFYERLSETLGEGLYVQDAQGRCAYMNSEAEKLLGWSRQEFLGKSVHDTIHTQTASGDPLPGYDCPIMLNVKAQGETHLEDQVFVRKDGSIFPVSLVSKATFDETGKLDTMVVAFSDITQRKHTELAMRQAKESAEAAVRIKSDFLANMSHEIRTPMNGIIGMTNLALETDLNAEQRDYIGMVKTSSDALLQIINDILDFSKIESGKMSIESIEFSLEVMLRDTMKTLALRAHQKKLELLLHVAPDVPDRIKGDPGRIRQVILNLVGNAIKFTAKGEVEVSVTRQDGAPQGYVRLHFSVRDTGIGIPQDKLKSIFESFSQADTSTTRKYGGTGLGLTISAQLVELMGSQIELISQVGKGSTFHFDLAMPVTSGNALAWYQKTGSIADMTVLVVDDNETNRRLLAQMLTNWHMRPSTVANGEQALEELTRANQAGTPYSLAVLDVQMPGMDGFELVLQMRQLVQTTVTMVMMLSSQGQRGDAKRCRELGVASYLSKPVSQSDLLDAIMTALGEPLQDDTPLITQYSLQENRRSLRLLLAEDNAINQKLAITLLQKQGHTVTVANNGLEALSHWEIGGFDAILMDVDMPEMNGYEATERIRLTEKGSAAHIPIVAMTAHAMQGAREECLARGMDGYLSKPIDVTALWHELGLLMPLLDQAAEQVRLDVTSANSHSATALEGTPTEPLSVANFGQLRQTIDNSRELFEELVNLYMTDAPVQHALLQAGLAQGDADAVRRAAHSLKGMVGVFAAERTLAAAQMVEDSAGKPDCTVAAEKLSLALDEFAKTLKVYAW